ncbi:MAG: ATP-binding cassette domain-containing protein [Pseudomonadota bacterium]
MTPAPGLFLRGRAESAGKLIFGPIELTAPAGKWTCLLGPSGVGKSTVLRLIAGLEDDIRLQGSCGTDGGGTLQGQLALMAQSDLLMPWLDVTENMILGARLRGGKPDMVRARDILEQMGLSAHASKKPHALSGGQRQRVALARTLMEDKPVVLLDEPFSALDLATRARMQDLAHKHLAARTVLHVTHDAGEAARMGDRILLMTADGLTEVAPPEGPAPRPADSAETLASMAELTRLLLDMAPV